MYYTRLYRPKLYESGYKYIVKNMVQNNMHLLKVPIILYVYTNKIELNKPEIIYY